VRYARTSGYRTTRSGNCPGSSTTTSDTDLLGALRSYLAAAGNKSVAAKAVGLSRQAFYQRLRTIERLLGCHLESGAQRTQLHVAVLALDAITGTDQAFP
jgi:DNA-binding PucR family transcriptional regulator